MITLNEEQIKCISEDLDMLAKLFEAVDDYLYDPKNNTYTPGHSNPERIDDLREAFIAVWNRPGDDARDILAQARK